MTTTERLTANVIMLLALLPLAAAPFAPPAARGQAPPASDRAFPPGCVASNGTSQAFPRAGLSVVNLSPAPITITLHPRPIAGIARTEFGTIAPQSTRTFAHALPAGRNTLTGIIAAEGASRRVVERIIYVANHGEATCTRRYLWRVR